MASKIIWDSNPSATTLTTTALDSLANDGRILSDVIDNSVDLNSVIDFEMYIAAQGSARSSNAVIDIYLLPSVDGTNYPGSASSDPPVNRLIGSFSFSATTSAERDVLAGVQLPPGLHKVVLKNRTGQALASSANTLKFRTYSLEAQ